MKRLSILIGLAFLSIAVSACSTAAPVALAGSPTVDQGPRVTFAAPAPGATVPFGPVQLLLLSEDPRGTAQVEVLVNGESAVTIPSPDTSKSAVVLQYSWQPPASGNYVLQAHGQNTAGTWGAFASLELTVAEAVATESVETPSPFPAPTNTSIVATATRTETAIVATTAPVTPTNSGITLKTTLSYTQMYVADAPCGTTTNMATATVTPADSAYSVLIFFRLGTKDGTAFKPWKGWALGPNGPGKFYLLFTTRHIALPMPWVPSQVWYQFVAINKSGEALYRTPVYTNLSIIKCP
jgi:hypothetical protein